MKLTVRVGAIISALLFLIASMVAGRSEETNVEAIPWHHNHPTEQTSTPVSKGSPEDEAAIRKIVADGTDAWNRRDAQALAAHISEDGDHINVDGAWRSGRAETERALSAALATTRNNMTSYVAKIRFVTPDVAVVVVQREYSNEKETRESISTSVFHKINGAWWNEAFQNTFVQPPESIPTVTPPEQHEAVVQAAKENPIAQAEPEPKTPTNSGRTNTSERPAVDQVGASEDEAAIRKIVAENTDAWNRRDAKALAAHISEDHDQIGVNGGWGSGRAQFEKALTAMLATSRNNMTSAVAKIRFVTADVAVVVVRREYTNDKETGKAISTSVFHKMNGEWWIEAFQNTLVRPR